LHNVVYCCDTTTRGYQLGPTHASRSRRVARAIGGVCDFVLVCVSCPRSERKTTSATNYKLGTHILYGRTSAGIDPEVKRLKSRSQYYEVCCRRGCACRDDCL